MSALTFPDSPSTGDYHTVNGKTWRYDGLGWSFDPVRSYESRKKWKGARLHQAADITYSTSGSWTLFTWDTEGLDTDGFVALGTSASRITIPAGSIVTKVRLHCALKLDAADGVGSNQVKFYKNGATGFAGDASASFPSGYTNNGLVLTSGVVTCAPGDYFEVVYFSADGFVLDGGELLNFFELEVLEESVGNALVPGARVGTFFTSAPTASEVVMSYIFADAVDFPDEFLGSLAKAGTAATASTVFDVKKNGTNVGTITFAASGTAGTFATTGTTVAFAAGDVLAVVAPASPDATLAGVSLTFKGTYT